MVAGIRYLPDNTTIDFDNYSVNEIRGFISKGYCTEADVVAFYNNEWWKDYEVDQNDCDDYNTVFRYPRIQVCYVTDEE